GNEGLVFLRFLLLRPDEQEIEDRDHQDEGQEGPHQTARPRGRARRRLGVSGGYEHSHSRGMPMSGGLYPPNPEMQWPPILGFLGLNQAARLVFACPTPTSCR